MTTTYNLFENMPPTRHPKFYAFDTLISSATTTRDRLQHVCDEIDATFQLTDIERHFLYRRISRRLLDLPL